jgi:hypothetical protein
MTNGVPVIGSNRGGIQETLGYAGSVLPIPDCLSPTSPSQSVLLATCPGQD